ncbi:glycoside hydrolase [Dactylonectria estremocensis]|uniref:Glycoside hydrolase n=1 Tax=Dactylonectria estremocensis TaxID=1079267 RepID=A0A9P9JHT0_9HYPO|nr:glycoside hydrolase [Dactylonectria estremocensis]
MFVQLRLLLALLLASGLVDASLNSIKTYPIPEGITQRDTYVVKVRNHVTKWKTLETYEVPHHEINITTGRATRHKGSMAYFDFTGKVEVSVTYVAGSVSSARIRPDSYGIVPSIKKNTITFTLDRPRNVVVHATEDVFDVLHLFSNSIVDERRFKDDPNVIYFGPGYHLVEEIINVPSGKTVYLGGGSVVEASVNLSHTTGSSLRGHGILYKSHDDTIKAWRSKDTLVEDIIVLDPGHYTITLAEAEDATIRGIRSFSAVQWGDGIDIFSSKNVLIDGVFLRTSDDSIALYTHRWDYYGDTTNITIQNSSLWADVAHPINVGTHGNTLDPETLSGITIRNVDILDHREFQMGYQGCIALNPGDSNLIEDVLVDDVRVEDFRYGQLITMMVMYNQKYNTSPGRGISNVTIRNLSYHGTKAGTTIITGYNETRGIESVKFENLNINGQKISDTMAKPGWYLASDYIPAYVNEHVKSLTFVG